LWIAVVGLVLALALGACSEKKAEDESGSGAPAAETVSGGTITWGKPSEAIALDPQTSLLGSSWELLHMVYDNLITLDENLEVVPELAEKWDQPSPTEYVFHLRKDAKFSNGRALTADDVVGTFSRLLNPKTGSIAPAQLGFGTRFEKVDDYTVRAKLDAPNAGFLPYLANVDGAILPWKELEAGTLDPTKELLGTGPFMVQSHDQDRQWVLARNPHAWQKPKADRVVIKIMPDDNARIAALRDGTVDITYFDAPDAPRLLGGIADVEIADQGRSDMYVLQVNARGVFEDPSTRQAVAYALDRDKIKDVALAGRGEVTSAVPPQFTDPGCDTGQLPGYTRDVDKAKSLLSKAGKAGASVDLIYTGQPFGQIAQVIEQQLTEAGFKVKLSNLEEGVWLKRAWQSNPAQMGATVTWYAGLGGPTNVMNWWNPKLAGFTAGFTPFDPKIAQGIERARKEGSAAAVQEACTALAEEAITLPLVTKPVTIAYRSDQIAAEIQKNDGYIDPMKTVGSMARVQR
jgi:peptide/nickel transport system substrate-binding protein